MIRVQSLRNRIVVQFVLIIAPLALLPLVQTLFNLQRAAALESSSRLRQNSVDAVDAYTRFIEGVTDAVDTGALSSVRAAALGKVLGALDQQKSLDADHTLDDTVESLKEIERTVSSDLSFDAIAPLRLTVVQVNRALADNREYYEQRHQRSIQEAIDGTKQQNWFILAAMLISIVLAGFFVRGMVRGLTRPLSHAIGVANRIAGGDIVAQDEVRTDPDLGGLLESLRQMNASLLDYRRQVADHERSLEDKIAERTSELGRSVARLQALAEVGEAVNSTLDLEEVLETIVSRAMELVDASVGTLYELADDGILRLRTVKGVSIELAELVHSKTLNVGEGASGRAVQVGEPVQIIDVDDPTDPYASPLRALVDRVGVRSLLAVPLKRESRVFGALTLARRVTGTFPPELVELVQTFASQSTLAIQNARLFREIEAKRRELEIASQHKSQFLANMSHELRTPLNAILGYTELIVDQIYGTVPDKILDVLVRVQRSGRHLLGLINDVLDMSKIEAGQVQLSLKDYSLPDTVATVVSSIESLVVDKGLKLTVAVDSDLPVGFGDDRRLAQVLLNLVGNAVKFTDEGGVTVAASRTDGQFLVSVADTGPGIPQSHQQRIFEEFQQVDNSSTRAKGGTGLGLAIAKRIVEMHGGRLWVESAEGSGSTFYLRIPIRTAQQGDVA